MNFETVYELKPIVAGRMAVDLYAVDAANGTHWVERFHSMVRQSTWPTTRWELVTVRVLHPWGTEPQVCELDATSTVGDWIACIEENIANDQRPAPQTASGRLIEEVKLPS